MKLAVLMSTYNGEKYVEEQINSILNQSIGMPFQLIIRDDGSSDETLQILEKITSRDSRVSYYVGENIGPAASFIDLVMNSNGFDFYSFSDQDDVWDVDKLQKGLDIIQNQELPTVYCSNARLVDKDMNYLGRDVYKNTPKTDFYSFSIAGGILGCTSIINERLAEIIRNHGVPTNMVMHDFYIYLVCLAVGGEIIYDNKSSMSYRQHGNNVVGVNTGIRHVIYDRLQTILVPARHNVANQSEDILRRYGEIICPEYKEWMKRLSVYDQKIIYRIYFCITRKTSYMNVNNSLKLRLAMLFGNR